MTWLTDSQKKRQLRSMKKFLIISILSLNAACAGQNSQVSPEIRAQKSQLREIADSERDSGDELHASELNQAIISLDEHIPDSFIDLAKILKKQGYKEEALDLLETGEQFFPENEKLQLETGKTMLENDRPDDAIVKLESINKLKNKDYYNTLGVANDMLGNHKAAQDAFIKGLRTAPKDGLLLNNLALSYILEHKYDQGIKILKGLVKRPDAKPKYRENLALAYGIIAKPDQARELLMKDMSKQEADENIRHYNEIRQNQQGDEDRGN